MLRQPNSFSENALKKSICPSPGTAGSGLGAPRSLRAQLREGPCAPGRRGPLCRCAGGTRPSSATVPAPKGGGAAGSPAQARPRVTTVLVSDSSFGHSRLVKDNLIDFFVPFLPLEYRHVRLCARDAFLSQKLPYTEEDLDQIATMMVYVPQEEKIFSSQGCKSISQRINYFLP